MKLLPSFVSPETKSSGERRLFELLKSIDFGESAFCLHSLNLPEHLYKAAGELDFVVIIPDGIFILEVKGGGVTFKDGIWHHQNRWGRVNHSSEGPFKQAQSGMYSMIERIGCNFSILGFKDVVIGYGVVFPDCTFNTESVEWDLKIVFDNRSWNVESLRNYILNLSRYWHNKFPSKPARISVDNIKAIRTALRPDFELAPNLQSRAGLVDAQLERLTEEQYERLDMVEHSDRLLFEGGAGTGKTFLAAEIARRHALQGQNVLFVCFSPLLASFLRGRIAQPKITIIPIHQLMLDHVLKYSKLPDGYVTGMDVRSSWFRSTLAPEYHKSIQKAVDLEKFDVLIVDEGQDIINLEYMAVLDPLLHGGLQSGVWRFFLDPNTQSEIFSLFENDALELLKSYSLFAPRLKKNCRNTNPIVLQTYLHTGADLNAEGAGPGPDVSISYYSNANDAAALLEKSLRELQNQQIPEGDITILSPLPWAESSARRIKPPLLSRIKVLRGSLQDTFPDSRTTFSTIADFKGLENRFVILTDVTDLDSTPLAISKLYVGMTRPRVMLLIHLHESMRKRHQELAIANLKRMN